MSPNQQEAIRTGPVVVLVGVPGSGKTTVGQAIAAELEIEFDDTDQMIERLEQRSVSDIFIQDGEEQFRAIERDVVADAVANHTGVLALGGGAVLDAGSRELLADQPTVWLTVDTDTAVRRVGLNAPRPVLLGNVRGQLKALMTQREPLYTEVATFAIGTADRQPDEIAAEIITRLNLRASDGQAK